MRIPSELWVVGGFLNEARTQECRNQELSPQNSKAKSFNIFHLIFLSCVFPLVDPKRCSVCWAGFVVGQVEEKCCSKCGGPAFPTPFGLALDTGVSWHVPLPALARAALASCPPTWWVQTVGKPSTEQRRRKDLHGRAASQLLPAKG